MARKPTGGKPFDDLMRKLIQVPKKALDLAARKEAKRKERKRKS